MVESLFRGHVTWDRRADDRIGVFHPAQIGILRTHFDGVLTIASRRLRQHDAGEELGPLDCRIAAIGRRRSGDYQAVSELETVLATANRADHAFEALPTTGGVVHLRGPDSCFLFGPAALDVTMAIIEWVTRWSRGEVVDGLACPGQEALDMWLEQLTWLNDDIVEPLRPDAGPDLTEPQPRPDPTSRSPAGICRSPGRQPCQSNPRADHGPSRQRTACNLMAVPHRCWSFANLVDHAHCGELSRDRLGSTWRPA
jgi:hypothetical protein